MKNLISLLCAVIFIFNINLSAIIFGNQVPPPPPSPDDEKSGTSMNVGNVEIASNYYFKFKSGINKYFAEVEIKGLSTGKEYLENSIKYLDLAITWYSITKENVYLTKTQEGKYRSFDYSTFLNDPDYHKKTMAKVAEYFSAADIKGFFAEIINNLTGMRDLIDSMTEPVKKEDLWLLYRLSSNEFGHYGTVVSNAVFK